MKKIQIQILEESNSSNDDSVLNFNLFKTLLDFLQQRQCLLNVVTQTYQDVSIIRIINFREKKNVLICEMEILSINRNLIKFHPSVRYLSSIMVN